MVLSGVMLKRCDRTSNVIRVSTAIHGKEQELIKYFIAICSYREGLFYVLIQDGETKLHSGCLL